jgi:hypothetical protein
VNRREFITLDCSSAWLASLQLWLRGGFVVISQATKVPASSREYEQAPRV